MKPEKACKWGHRKSGLRYRKDKRCLELFCIECHRRLNREYARKQRERQKVAA